MKHVALSGGQADGWDAPALNQASTAPEPWTEARLFLYLRTGVEDRHGAAAGPMAPVIAELSRVPEADVQAIAIYIASLMPAASASPAAQPAVRPVTADAAILFAGACGACHGPDAPGGRVSLALSTTLAAPEPNDAARLLLVGLQPPAGQSGPFMPGFAEALTDTQLAELLRYLREDIAGRPAWTDLDDAIRRARQPATE
ncbi:MAG: c-type cytochrome [Aliidongia sp.]